MNVGTFMGTIALCALCVVVYSYVLFPALILLVGLLASSRTKRLAAPADVNLPRVAVVLAAHNEERHIADRIRNLLALDYPPDLVSIHVGDDGSTDRTPQLLDGFRDERVHVHRAELNRGKAAMLNRLVSCVTEPIVVFTDANTNFRPDALRQLVAAFVTPDVGCVCGELVIVTPTGRNVDSMYWALERRLKQAESLIGGLLGANGAIYAIRRSLWRDIPPDTICDDFNIAMRVSAQGFKLLYVPNAVAEEEAPLSIREEYKRRIRIGIGNYQSLFEYPEFILRTSMATRFTYLSHKVLRWLAPHLLILGLLGSACAAATGRAWLAFLMLQCLAYVSVALLYVASERCDRPLVLPKLIRIPVYLFALNWAFLIASIRYLRKSYSGTWSRTAR